MKRKAALDDDRADLPLHLRCGWRRCCASRPRRPGSRAIPRRTAPCIWSCSPKSPAAWRDEALAEKWEKIKRVRRVVTGALEIERAAKRIGSSLEAAPQVFIADDAS